MRARLVLCAALVAAIGIATSVPPAARAGNPDPLLTITLSGTGSGAWQTTDFQIDCRIFSGVVDPDPRNVCSAPYEYGETVSSNLVPAEGSCVIYGGGCIAGVVPVSYVLTVDKTDSAQFNLISYEVSVSKSGSGSGTVTSAPAGISCGATCSVIRLYGTTTTLTATPDTGADFQGWTGACAGQGAACSLTINGAMATNAVFTLEATAPPSTGPTASPGGPKPSKPGPTAVPTRTPSPTAPSSAAPTLLPSVPLPSVPLGSAPPIGTPTPPPPAPTPTPPPPAPLFAIGGNIAIWVGPIFLVLLIGGLVGGALVRRGRRTRRSAYYPTDPHFPTDPHTPLAQHVLTDASIPTDPHIPSDPHYPTDPHTPLAQQVLTDTSIPTEPHYPTEPHIPSDPHYPGDPHIPSDPR